MFVFLALFLPYIVGCMAPCVIMLLAAWQDWHELKIDNKHSLVLLALFLPLAMLSPTLHVVPGLIAAMSILLVGMVFYAMRVMGAGDVKLASAISLYLGLSGLSNFILGTALSGGVLAIIALISRRYPLPKTEERPSAWIGCIRQRGLDLPYAVAMVGPACFVLTQRLVHAYLDLTHI